MVTRRENWPILLSNYLEERRTAPFEWGVNDCLSFVSGAVAAITGYNFQDEYLPYNTEELAQGMLDEYGGVEGIISESLGHQGTDKVLTAGRGDVVLYEATEGDTAGVVDDTGRYFCVITQRGLIRLPLTKASKVWSY